MNETKQDARKKGQKGTTKGKHQNKGEVSGRNSRKKSQALQKRDEQEEKLGRCNRWHLRQDAGSCCERAMGGGGRLYRPLSIPRRCARMDGKSLDACSLFEKNKRKVRWKREQIRQAEWGKKQCGAICARSTTEGSASDMACPLEG